MPPYLGSWKQKARREDGFAPNHLTLSGTGRHSLHWEVPDTQRSGNGSVSGAVYLNTGSFGARLTGPFRGRLGVGLSPLTDSLCLHPPRTRPGRSL